MKLIFCLFYLFLYKIIFSLKEIKKIYISKMLEDDMSMGHDSPNLLALNYY